MEIFEEITDLKTEYPSIVMALGMFDWMHRGHRSIVQRAIDMARSVNGKSLVFTFLNHPLSVVDPGRMPLAIGSGKIRADVLRKMGVDILVNIKFTESFSHILPEKFLELIRDNYAPVSCVVGPNYTFGYKGAGTPELLTKICGNYGFTADIAPAVRFGDKLISSTRIRELIRMGDLSTVNDFLGRPLDFCGEVVHGEERGRSLGFPTANLLVSSKQAVLPDGAYASYALAEGKSYGALVNIGRNPTFDGEVRRIEAYLDGFDGDLYGKMLKLEFLQRLRDEKKFSSAEELKEQLERDKIKAALYWNFSETR